jgi:hypothetical protein
MLPEDQGTFSRLLSRGAARAKQQLLIQLHRESEPVETFDSRIDPPCAGEMGEVEKEERSQLLWIYGFTCAGDNDCRKMRPGFVGESPVSLWRADESRAQPMIQFVAESGAPESFDAFLCDLLVANWTSPGGPCA